jgi:MarR family
MVSNLPGGLRPEVHLIADDGADPRPTSSAAPVAVHLAIGRPQLVRPGRYFRLGFEWVGRDGPMRPLERSGGCPILHQVEALRNQLAQVAEFSILAKLKRLGPMTINILPKEMVMDRTTLGRNVQPLERDSLIKIEPSATDGRAKELDLTKARKSPRRLEVIGSECIAI